MGAYLMINLLTLLNSTIDGCANGGCFFAFLLLLAIFPFLNKLQRDNLENKRLSFDDFKEIKHTQFGENIGCGQTGQSCEDLKNIIDKYSQLEKSGEYLGFSGQVDCEDFLEQSESGQKVLYKEIKLYTLNSHEFDDAQIWGTLHKFVEDGINYKGSIYLLGKRNESAVFKVSDDTESIKLRIKSCSTDLPEKAKIYRSPFIDIKDIVSWDNIRDVLINSDNPYAKRIREFIDRKSRAKYDKLLSSSSQFSSDHKKRQLLIRTLNDILKNRKFYEPEVFKDLLVGNRVEKYLIMGVDKLTDNEMIVFNRLLYEYIFDNGLCKKTDVIEPELLDYLDYSLCEQTDSHDYNRSYFIYKERRLNLVAEMYFEGNVEFKDGVFQIILADVK
jgi:hypothetical protein